MTIAVLVRNPHQKKSQSVFDHLATHRPVLMRIARRSAPRDRAEDLVQDTFERALRCSSCFVLGTNAIAWLSTILRRLMIDDHRKTARDRIRIVSVDSLCIADFREQDPPWAALEHSDLSAAVERLGEQFRSVYRLHALEGRSYLEISQMTGIPVTTVGTRLNRARKKLREILSRVFEPQAYETPPSTASTCPVV